MDENKIAVLEKKYENDTVFHCLSIYDIRAYILGALKLTSLIKDINVEDDEFLFNFYLNFIRRYKDEEITDIELVDTKSSVQELEMEEYIVKNQKIYNDKWKNFNGKTPFDEAIFNFSDKFFRTLVTLHQEHSDKFENPNLIIKKDANFNDKSNVYDYLSPPPPKYEKVPGFNNICAKIFYKRLYNYLDKINALDFFKVVVRMQTDALKETIKLLEQRDFESRYHSESESESSGPDYESD
jgi:hypothetical protein